MQDIHLRSEGTQQRFKFSRPKAWNEFQRHLVMIGRAVRWNCRLRPIRDRADPILHTAYQLCRAAIWATFDRDACLVDNIAAAPAKCPVVLSKARIQTVIGSHPSSFFPIQRLLELLIIGLGNPQLIILPSDFP
ncbi:hypothetical protein D3C77_608490 [compost metagenome]